MQRGTVKSCDTLLLLQPSKMKQSCCLNNKRAFTFLRNNSEALNSGLSTFYPQLQMSYSLWLAICSYLFSSGFKWSRRRCEVWPWFMSTLTIRGRLNFNAAEKLFTPPKYIFCLKGNRCQNGLILAHSARFQVWETNDILYHGFQYPVPWVSSPIEYKWV